MGYITLWKIHGTVQGRKVYLGSVTGWTQEEALGKAKGRWPHYADKTATSGGQINK